MDCKFWVSYYGGTKRTPAVRIRKEERSGLFAEISLDAAVNVQDLTVDEVGCIGSQEHGGTGKVLGLAPAACGGAAHQEGVEGMIGTIGLLFPQRRGLGGLDVAGTNAVALDVVGAELGADVPGQHLQTALGGCISGNSLTAKFTGQRANVDDLTLVLGDHAGQNCLPKFVAD